MKRLVGNIVLSVMLIAPLTALLYLVRSVAGVPFPAFDLMDFMIRNLPGGIITFGIDTMTDLILAIQPDIDLDSAAKTSERWIAVLQFVGIGTLLGVGYIYIAQGLHGAGKFFATEWATGLLLGLVVGIGLAFISAEYNVSATASVAVSAVWIIATSLAWGLLHNALQRYLLTSPLPAPSVPLGEIRDVTILDRRQFLVRVGATTAAITVIGAGLGELLKTSEAVAGGNLQIEGLEAGLEAAPGTRAEYTPLKDHYRIDINTGDAPAVDTEAYRLKITGLVEQDLEVSLLELRAYEPLFQFVTLSCISNRIGGRLISTTRWTGVPMQKLLADWRPTPEATHIKITSFDGFYEILAIETIMQDDRVMLTYDWDGVPLPAKHGFPLRVYIPDRYGMKQPKWIEQMEFISAWEEGYWVKRGWSKEAFVKTTSVIDTVAVDSVFELDGVQYVPVGGIAYSGAKGISKVEVQVDDGEWLPAKLRQPLSGTSWVVWRLDWALQPGEHTFTVRAYEADDTPQIEARTPQRPDGATGYHSLDDVKV